MLIIREGNSHFVVSIEYLFKTREAAKVRCHELASFPLFSSRISFSFKVARLGYFKADPHITCPQTFAKLRGRVG